MLSVDCLSDCLFFQGGFLNLFIHNAIDQSPRNYQRLIFIGSKCLLKVSIIKGAGEGLICHRPKSTNVFIVGEGSVQGVNYKRGSGGADLFAIDQNPRMYLSSETLRVGSKCQLFSISMARYLAAKKA